MPDYSNEKAVAARIAKATGKIVLEYYQRDITVDLKVGNEPVTDADRAANDFILEEIKREFPQDLIISEESVDDPQRLTAQRFWLVDPLDGTKEFIARNGEFSIMIGLIENGRAVAGAIYQPTEDRLWWGDQTGSMISIKGDEAPLKVSSKSDFRDMSAVISRSHRGGLVDSILKHLEISREITSGSGGIKLGLIASGDAELMFSPSSGYKIWDICAPEAVLAGAGGRVTDFRGDLINYQDTERRLFNGILASNGTRHDDMVARMSGLVTLPFGSTSKRKAE